MVTNYEQTKPCQVWQTRGNAPTRSGGTVTHTTDPSRPTPSPADHLPVTDTTTDTLLCSECNLHPAEPGDEVLCAGCEIVYDAGHSIWHDITVNPAWATTVKLICQKCGAIGVAPDPGAEDAHRVDAYVRALVDRGVIPEHLESVARNLAQSGVPHAKVLATFGDLTD